MGLGNSNGSALMTPEDRERLTDLLDVGIEIRDRRGTTLDCLDELWTEWIDGDESAGRIVKSLAYDGLYRALDREIKRPTGLFINPATGQKLNVPKVASIAVRNADGSPTGERQARLWLEMGRLEFNEMLNQRRHLADSLGLEVHGFERIERAWATHSDCLTAREVCDRAGIDPDELDVAA